VGAGADGVGFGFGEEVGVVGEGLGGVENENTTGFVDDFGEIL